jgi:hypothetical protein
MALIVRKSNIDKLLTALQAKRTIGSLSTERKEIRKIIHDLKINDTIEIDLPEELAKKYNSGGKVNVTHPILDKIRLEVKDFNNQNRGDDGLYIIVYKEGDIAYLTKHYYNDIKSAITKSSNGNERVNRSKYHYIIENKKNK